MDEREQIVANFWEAFDRADFGTAGEMLAENAEILWPNTGELFKGRVRFIEVQKHYPGRWRISLEKVVPAQDTIVTVVRVTAEDRSMSFYATSFFEFEGGRIRKITEYWGDVGQPPEWRVRGGWAERF